jgi:S-adenosylmethionine-dependent methyltransferase
MSLDENVSKWNAGAPAYAGYLSTPAGRFRASLIWDTLQSRLPPPPLRVLEVGCGTGELACFLAERGDQVVATDWSPEMILQTTQRADALPHDARLRLEARSLDVAQVASHYPPASFDCLVAHTVLEYQPDPAAIFAQLLTLLARGGIASVVQINHVSKVLRAALNQRDFRTALTALEDRTILADTFGISAQTTTLPDLLALFERNGLDALGSYGIRVFLDYLPAAVRDDPVQRDSLLRLERAVCGLEPYRSMARYVHILGVKR